MNAGVDPTDIIAIVLLAMYSMRRMEVRATDPRAFPAISGPDFAAWKERAILARSVAVHGCFLKLALNTVWFYGLRSRVGPRVLQTGGLIFFFGWIVALLVAWWLAARSKAEAGRLGIVIGRRIVESPPV
jgi:hypothetical protein